MIAVGLDLGSTRIKLAVLGDAGTVGAVESLDAPPITAPDALRREFDVDDYRFRAESLLRRAPPRASIGIASQRSTFVLWDRASGRPVGPAISWQDRRAAQWCTSRPRLASRIPTETGLVLSPHYAAPKLALLLRTDSGLAARLGRGEVAFGTLDSYLLWHWSGRSAHEIDLTMAARTLLVDPRRNCWSAELCRAFDVPRASLPGIVPTSGRHTPIGNGSSVTCSISDQAAGLLATLPPDGANALVNLGTGSFVLRPTGASFELRTGFLSGPVRADPQRACFALEGTINAGGATLDRFGRDPEGLADHDRFADAFCLPDEHGVGAPHWLPERRLELSPGARALSLGAQRAVALEGLVFRVRELVDGLFGPSRPVRVVLAGGLARDPCVAPTLAATIGLPVELSTQVESTLDGAARLAAGLSPCAPTHVCTIYPDPRHAWLAGKYVRWKHWLTDLLASAC